MTDAGAIPAERRDRDGRKSWPAIIVGAIVALIGVVLMAGGGWLAVLGGSIYYVLTGLAMIVSGILLVRGRLSGAWLYAAIVVLTIIWAWWEVGPDGWAQVARVVAPVVLLVAVILVLPTLTAHVARWKYALAASAAVLVLTIANFVIADAIRGNGRFAELPASGGAIARQAAAGTDWPVYGGTETAQRYSALDQITPANVGDLERVWLAHTGDMPHDASGENKYGAETTPIKVGRRLYMCSATNTLLAYDAATGEEIWRFDPGVRDNWIPYTAACRGVVYYEQAGGSADAPCAARIVEGTLDGRLIAVDARNGRPCADFGENGQVDYKRGMGPVDPGMVATTAPPVVAEGVIVINHQVRDNVDLTAPSGVIQGFDAETGELVWAWDMMHPEWTGMPPEGQMWSRGTPNSWTTMTADADLGLVYVPMGSASGDYVSGSREPRENEFSTSLVALDIVTGRPRWRFQTVRKDVWDYDLGAQATLIDWPAPNGTTPALILPSKQGDMYVLDRRTGEPLTPVGTLRVPTGGVAYGDRSPTQPVSLWHTLRQPRLTEADMWGMSPIDQMVCRINFRRASYDGFYTPPTADRHYIEYPGYNGGTDWGGIAVDPAHGVIVANYNDMPNYNRLLPRASSDTGADTQHSRGEDMGEGPGSIAQMRGAPYRIHLNPGWRMPITGLMCKEPPYGGIRAIDLRTGETIWNRPLGEARRNGPFGVPSMLPIDIGTPNNGGAVVTAGGLIFIAAATDNLIRAIDLRTGETVWQDVLPAGGQATPMTYAVDGRQYVVIMVGGHHFMETPIGDEVIAYALPR